MQDMVNEFEVMHFGKKYYSGYKYLIQGNGKRLELETIQLEKDLGIMLTIYGKFWHKLKQQ